MNMIPNIKYKTILCKKWLENNKCLKQENCYFAHSQAELRTIQQNTQSIADNYQLLRNNQYYALYKLKQLQNYKTVKCKFFFKGECKLGENCTYAHDNQEIRSKVDFDTLLNYQIYYNQCYENYIYTNSYDFENYQDQFNPQISTTNEIQSQMNSQIPEMPEMPEIQK